MIRTENKLELNQEALNQLTKLAPLEKLLIFDIETTGFHRVYDHVVSITALLFENSQCIIKQWFSESTPEEKELLLDVKPYFDSKPIHITYNGHSFDIPFLKSKYNNYSTSIGLNKSKCYDLYRFARKALILDSYKLKNIERSLGIHRFDQISGKECTEMYERYLITHDPDLAKAILDHNYEDVSNLVDLFPLINRLSAEQLNEMYIAEIELHNRTWYIEQLRLRGSFFELELWSAADAPLMNSQQNFFLADGTAMILETLDYGEYRYKLQIPFYEKELDELRLTCLDLSSFNCSLTDELEPHHLIIQCNQLWMYEHINLILTQLIK